MYPEDNATHEEVWDDSALVDSWNEALQEYEKYHSIHARGERVEKVLEKFENGENGLDGEIGEDSGEVLEEHITTHSEFDKEDDHTLMTTKPKVDEISKAKEAQFHPSSSKAPTLPPQLIGQVHDENLKNLLMSWYYAGYYTGLYEGQQQNPGSSKNT